MTSPVFRPNQPVPASWAPAGGWPNTSSTTTSSRPRFYNTANGPVTLPSDWSDEDARQWVAAYDANINRLTQVWQQSSGIQRQQIEAQIEDMKRGRDNAMEIAKLQNDTQRYGYDQQRQNQIEQLKENQRQFDATHALELQRYGLDVEKLGLSRAQTATDYLSTTDRFAQAADFLNLSGRVMAGQAGVGAGSGIAPQMKTMSDYETLEAGGTPGRQASAMQVAGGPGAGADARIKALKTVMDANPPSGGLGYDDNDHAVLNVARAIYGLNLTPQQQASINASPDNKAILGSEIRRLGGSPDEWWAKQRRGLPSQQSARLAG